MTWAVVTGGSSEIGQACALQLAEDGYDVVVHYLRHPAEANRVAKSITELGVRSEVIRGRLDRGLDVDNFCKEVLELCGDVGALIVCSASGVKKDILDLTTHHIEWSLNTSTIPLLATARHLQPKAIVAISSLGSSRVVPQYGAIGMAKAALEAAVKYMGVELAPTCRVNAISSGLVGTRSARLLPLYEAIEEQALSRTPMQRLVAPQDIANLASFLVSPKSEMITGSTIVLDGGHSLRW